MTPACQIRLKCKRGSRENEGDFVALTLMVFCANAKSNDQSLRLNSLSTKPCIGLCVDKRSPLE